MNAAIYAPLYIRAGEGGIIKFLEPICLLTILAVSSPLKAQSFYGSILGNGKGHLWRRGAGRKRESDQHRDE